MLCRVPGTGATGAPGHDGWLCDLLKSDIPAVEDWDGGFGKMSC